MITEETEFQVLTFDADNKLATVVWQDNTKQMTEKQYQEEQAISMSRFLLAA